MTPKRLYLLLGAACAAGYLYLFYAMHSNPDPDGLGACMFRNVTGIPCPSCGSTRSVLAILKGEWQGAMLLNPLGYAVAAGLIAVPIWIAVDLVTGNRSLHRAWKGLERLIGIQWVALILIALIALNWIWNIYKES